MNFFEQLKNGTVLLLDGAMGTELERRNVDTSEPGWSSRAILNAPNIIREIHEEYLRAGADIITANTFRTNPRAHRSTGLDARELTYRAVKLAEESRGATEKDALIAGSIAPAEDCFQPELVPEDEEELHKEQRDMISWLAESGVDLLLIETMNTGREAMSAVKAAREVTSLPVIVSLVAMNDRSLLSGEPLEEIFLALSDAGANVLALNCTPLSAARQALPVLAKVARQVGKPFGAYPNMSGRNPDGSWNLCATTDEEILEAARTWIGLGAQLLGSCCGSTPATTRKLRKLVDSKRSE